MKVTKILYHRLLSLDQFRFCETHFTTYPRFVANKSAISPFLGGGCGRNFERGIVAVMMLRWLIEFVIFKWVIECVVFRWLIDFGVCDVARGLVAVVILRWLVEFVRRWLVEFVRRRRLKEFVIFRWLITIWVSTIAWLKDGSSHKLSHLEASHELWEYEWHLRNFGIDTFGMSEFCDFWHAKHTPGCWITYIMEQDSLIGGTICTSKKSVSESRTLEILWHSSHIRCEWQKFWHAKHTPNKTHIMEHDSLICGTYCISENRYCWLVTNTCVCAHIVGHDSLIYGTWLFDMWDILHISK